MKNIRRFSVLCLVFLLAAFLGFSAGHAEAAKQLQVGSAGPILNTGDDTARTVDLPITLKGGFNDANGLAFTLTYDKAVFDFIGLVQQTARIEDGTNDVPSPPAPATIASTIYYQANNKTDEGRVLIAAAGANFFSATTADVIPFKARFRVKLGMGLGAYPVGVQQTIIGPDTASSAGYTTYTPIPVATGLAPTALPTAAQSFAVQLLAGSISVSGGYSIGGTVKFADDADANGAIVRLWKKVDDTFVLNEEKTVSSGQYSFTGKSSGDYKVIVLASRPGYQDRYESGVITVAGNVTHNVTLLAYSPTAGTVKVNDVVVTGVKVKVMLDTTVIGTFPVDANGYFVTTPLDPTKTYTFYAVYGNAEQVFDPATPFNWTLGVGTLSGTITGLADGQNVMVHIVSATTLLEKMKSYTGSGSDVAYEFLNLLPGTDYIVSVVGDGIPVTYYDGVTDINSASPQTVVAGAPTSGVNFAFTAPTVAITGQITEGGTGVANVAVFSLETTTMAFQSTYSGTGGAYTLNLAAGNYLVFAYKESSQKSFYYSTTGTTQNDWEADSVTPPASGINISLDEDTCMISGRVSYRTAGGDPVAGIMVRAEGLSGSAVDVTDEDGNYDLTGLHCTGAYDVTIFPNSPYPPQTESATAAESTTLDFVIQTGWVVSGTVVEDGGGAIRGAWVYLLNSSGMVQGVPSITNDSGEYVLADVPSGVYTLVAEHGDYQTVKETDLVVEYDVTAHTITMVPGGSISGTVTDSATTNPLGGVLVIATRAGEDSRYATTNSSGQYEVKGLVSGNAYYVMFSKSGYVRQLAGPVTATQSGYDRALVAHAAPVTFSGTVQDSGGTGIASAYVVIQSSSPKYSAAASTGADGGFSFSNVVAGANYRLVVLPGGDLPIYVEENVNLSSSVSGYTITITGSTITGTVTLSDGATGKSVIVYLLDSTAGSWVADVDATDNNGDGTYDYELDGVGAGNYKVCAFSLGYSLGWYGGADFAGASTVTAGATLVDFTLTAN